MAGRPPALRLNYLMVGDILELKGRHKMFVYQYVYQFNNSPKRKVDKMRLEHYKEESTGKQFVRRVV